MLDYRTELTHLELRDSDGRFHVASEAEVDKALKLIEMYKTHYEMYTGAQPRISQKSLKHFYGAVLLAAEKGLSIEELAAYQFRSMSRIGVYQTSAIDSRLLLEHALADSNVTSDALGRYRANIALFEARSKLYGPQLAVTDMTNDFTPLFRSVMAHRLQIPDVVRFCYAAAVAEYHTNPVAKELFASDLGFLHPDDVA